MTPEELLKPRYKVIADWPGNKIKVGSISVAADNRCAYFDHILYHVSMLDMHPHLFKKLGWWQDRKQEEMPEYVKYKFMPDSEWRFIKVDRHLTNSFGEENLNIFLAEDDFFSYSKSLPVTEQEYLNQNQL